MNRREILKSLVAIPFVAITVAERIAFVSPNYRTLRDPYSRAEYGRVRHMLFATDSRGARYQKSIELTYEFEEDLGDDLDGFIDDWARQSVRALA